MTTPAILAQTRPELTFASPASARIGQLEARRQALRPVRRKMTPQAGRALEMLGHAIEYLADEHTLNCRSGQIASQVSGHRHPQVEAIEILKQCNREVYFSCEPMPAMAARLRFWLGLKAA